MKEENREEGYYWIRVKGDDIKYWQPAKWLIVPETWWIIGYSCGYEENEIEEIGEKIVKK